MAGLGVKILNDTRDEYGDNPNFLLYTFVDGQTVPVATLTFEQAQTLSESLSFFVDAENDAFIEKYGDFEGVEVL